MTKNTLNQLDVNAVNEYLENASKAHEQANRDIIQLDKANKAFQSLNVNLYELATGDKVETLLRDNSDVLNVFESRLEALRTSLAAMRANHESLRVYYVERVLPERSGTQNEVTPGLYTLKQSYKAYFATISVLQLRKDYSKLREEDNLEGDDYAYLEALREVLRERGEVVD